ncbi:MAG: DsbA family protein [Bdellovibrionales bacterium]
MKKSIFKAVLAVSVLGLFGCSKIVEDTIKKNPDIVINAMKENPAKFMEALNEAARAAQDQKRANADKDAQKEMEDQFANPAKPEIDQKRALVGPTSAPITIVEYSDFQCGYCGKGFNTLKQLMEKEYKGKIRFMYKHLPVTGAPMSLPAAEVFEAIAMMDKEKAYAFHDKIFEDQGALRNGGPTYLKKIVKDIMGGDAAKVFANTKNDEVQARLAADRKEAQKYQINGTPAFVVNGVFLKGAYPVEKFKEVIDRHLSAKK